MSSTDCIEQRGIIEEIENGTAKVKITSFSACASCTSKDGCMTSESVDKTISVFIGDKQFNRGELVKISMKKTLGLKATLLAYLLPFVVLLITLIILTEIGISEAISGLVSLAVLIPYFLVLYFFKHKLQKIFQFKLNKVI
jgi:sigma-E factor negative regulatory protein RseC